MDGRSEHVAEFPGACAYGQPGLYVLLKLSAYSNYGGSFGSAEWILHRFVRHLMRVNLELILLSYRI